MGHVARQVVISLYHRVLWKWSHFSRFIYCFFRGTYLLACDLWYVRMPLFWFAGEWTKKSKSELRAFFVFISSYKIFVLDCERTWSMRSKHCVGIDCMRMWYDIKHQPRCEPKAKGFFFHTVTHAIIPHLPSKLFWWHDGGRFFSPFTTNTTGCTLCSAVAYHSTNRKNTTRLLVTVWWYGIAEKLKNVK